ncbi:hypothetical protein HNR39_003587 [Glaciimonas immobilis]|uniref:Uncharacterized protein n=1 Tax=Glaciimonas immobilis TaxID=728004 RepID=A0A840RZF2_9BURK|nr:hypothetical protein [Glaciimonas immobilis]
MILQYCLATYLLDPCNSIEPLPIARPLDTAFSLWFACVGSYLIAHFLGGAFFLISFNSSDDPGMVLALE